MFQKLSILGPGLLGGSVGMAARQRQVATRVVVWARRPEAAEQAHRAGAADETAVELSQAVAGAELVVLAVPIGAMRTLAEEMTPALTDGCVVTDVGSVKYPVVKELSQILAGKARFVGSHPMAGSEQSGIEAARRDLFQGAVCILTPTEQTDKTALQIVHDFWKSLGCAVRTISPLQHDEIVGRVSHLPHLAAAAAVNVICRDGARGLEFTGPGFRDFTRIAGGPPEMWTEIAMENQQEIRRALDAMIDELSRMRAALENKDAIELRALLKRAKHFRDELKFRT